MKNKKFYKKIKISRKAIANYFENSTNCDQKKLPEQPPMLSRAGRRRLLCEASRTGSSSKSFQVSLNMNVTPKTIRQILKLPNILNTENVLIQKSSAMGC